MDNNAVLADVDDESELTPLVLSSSTSSSSGTASLSSYYSFNRNNDISNIHNSAVNTIDFGHVNDYNSTSVLSNPNVSPSIVSYSNLGLSTLNRSRSITNSTAGTGQNDQLSYQQSRPAYEEPTSSGNYYQLSPIAGYQLNSLLGVNNDIRNMLHESQVNNHDNDNAAAMSGNGVDIGSSDSYSTSPNRSTLACCCCTCGHCIGKVFSWQSLFTVLMIVQFAAIAFLRIDSIHKDKQYKGMINDLRQEFSDLSVQSKADYSELFNRSNDELHDMIDKHERFELISYKMMNKMNLNVTAISDAVGYHDRQLERLLNRTTNADVLDKLTETKSGIQRLVDDEQRAVLEQIQLSTKNVSDKLAKSSRELSETQRQVDSHLAQSVKSMRLIVDTATAQIETVQSDVTSQVFNVSSQFNSVVRGLEGAVLEAREVINEQVRAVKNDISQYVDITNKKFAAENDFVKYQLAGTFTLLACLLSFWHLTLHLRYYFKPDVQRRIMAVLWMVPIYSVTSWFSLVYPPCEPLLGAIRDVYEAYVIYTFIALLIAILLDGKGLQELVNRLGETVLSERQAIIDFEGTGIDRLDPSASSKGLKTIRPVEHIRPPCPCCYRRHRPNSVAAAWLYQCQLMAFQFVIINPLLTLVPLILKYSQVSDFNKIPMIVEGHINLVAPKLYIILAQNLSVCIAFYGLLKFYHGVEKELEWCDPWPKFLCVKGVVFATFWQNLVIQSFSTLGWIDLRAASQIQNLLICIEMLLASVAHFYIFSHEEWQDGYKKERQKGLMLRDTLALVDFVRDMHLMVTSWGGDEAIESPVTQRGPAGTRTPISVRSNRSGSTGANNYNLSRHQYNDFFQRSPYNHQDENCTDNRSSTDGMMILEDGLSSGFGQQYERHRYLESNTNTDANYSESNSQFGSFSNRSSRSSSSAMRGLELPEEELSSRLSQSLLQASLLSYKDASAPRSQYSHSHRSNSTRGDSKNSSKYGHLNELAASAKKSILRNLQQLMPEQGLTDNIKYTSGQHHRKSFDDYPISNVEADPRTACIENSSYNSIHRRSFDDINIFKSSRNLRSVEGCQRTLTSSFDSYSINCNNIANNERSKSTSKIDVSNNSCDRENHQNANSFNKFDNTSSQPRHRVIELIPYTSIEPAVDTALNDSLMLSPMNINDTSIASDAFSSNDSYDRLRIITNDREEGNDGYGIAMRNLDEYTEDGDLESDDTVCSV